MENTEPQNNKIATSVRIDLEVNRVIARLMADEGRPSMANMMERLLTTHPRVQKLLQIETTSVQAQA